jgi:DNA invertase Pin-like site-specific DNA recombinase
MESILPRWLPSTASPQHPFFDARPIYVGESKAPEGHNFKNRIAPEIAAEIRRLYGIKGMTKMAIAKKLGISRSTVVRYCGVK